MIKQIIAILWAASAFVSLGYYDVVMPDLSIGMIDSIGGELDTSDPGFEPLATTTLLLHWLSTKHNLNDLAKKSFPANESKNTSKKW